MTKPNLTPDDIAGLLSVRSVEAKVETTAKLAKDFDSGILSDKERQLAEDIFRLMARDAELRVREALAVNLKESMALPHDIAKSLAQDVDAVALPVLQFSKALTDADLVEIVKSQGVAKQVAIAKRGALSAEVSETLVETHNKDVVSNLLENESASLSEDALQKVLDDFGSKPEMQGSLVRRAKLPVTVAERLVTMVSDQMRDHLVARHGLPPDMVAALVGRSRERATITLTAGIDREDVEVLVRQLDEHGRLTPSILLRGVCMGDMPFFEAALAKKANVLLINAQRLIHDYGGNGFRALYTKASMPEPMFPAFSCAIEVARDNVLDGGDQDRERYCRRMIERILTQYEDLGIGFASDDLEYLLSKMDQLPATPLSETED